MELDENTFTEAEIQCLAEQVKPFDYARAQLCIDACEGVPNWELSRGIFRRLQAESANLERVYNNVKTLETFCFLNLHYPVVGPIFASFGQLITKCLKGEIER